MDFEAGDIRGEQRVDIGIRHAALREVGEERRRRALSPRRRRLA